MVRPHARPVRAGLSGRAAACLAAALCLAAAAGCSAATGTPTARSASEQTSATRTGAIWHPRPGLTWQWQLTEPVDTSVAAQVYDIDAVENGAGVVAALHAAGRKVICYVDAGTVESYRADAQRFPPSVVGKPNGWPGERWLDIRRLDVLRPIMADRFKVCAAKGFDGVEADNVDGYENDSGFPLTAADQLTYNRMLVTLAHADGLAIGLKNDLDQVPDLVSAFDFSVDEQCFEYDECDELEPFIAAGKAVFEAEYNMPAAEFCPQAAALHLSAMRKNAALDAVRRPCP